MRIALDAMGGDYAPAPNIDGAITAIQADPSIEIVLVGDAPQLEKLLSDRGFSDPRLTIRAADGWITMDEKPTEALRKKPNCSLAVCWQLMSSRDTDAVVSAGHTGAVVAAGLRTRLFLKGVKRPGIAVTLPTLSGRTVLMDVGANPAARPEHLFQYGLMADIYAKEVLGIEKPRVGIINIGSEDGKGNELVRETHDLLAKSCLQERYLGNVEGRGVYQGEADVLICEGFVGNVVLKVSEGIADMLLKTVSRYVVGSLKNERETATVAFKEAGKQFAYNESGGAPLLGIDGVCIICHGSSDAVAIHNALLVTRKFAAKRINEQISERLAMYPEL
ncbi:MAG: phosphate acyltransferase PlsX [Planctomycetaceae bacterium]|nr:phosphate acyltransferase PlsX [Planctomycetaceae bacterium]